MNRFQRSAVVFIIGLIILSILIKMAQWVLLKIRLEEGEEFAVELRVIVVMVFLVISGIGALLFHLRMLHIDEPENDLEDGIVDSLPHRDLGDGKVILGLHPLLWLGCIIFTALTISISLWFLFSSDTDLSIRVFNRDIGAYSVVIGVMLFALLLVSDLWSNRKRIAR